MSLAFCVLKLLSWSVSVKISLTVFSVMEPRMAVKTQQVYAIPTPSKTKNFFGWTYTLMSSLPTKTPSSYNLVHSWPKMTLCKCSNKLPVFNSLTQSNTM